MSPLMMLMNGGQFSTNPSSNESELLLPSKNYKFNKVYRRHTNQKQHGKEATMNIKWNGLVKKGSEKLDEYSWFEEPKKISAQRIKKNKNIHQKRFKRSGCDSKRETNQKEKNCNPRKKLQFSIFHFFFKNIGNINTFRKREKKHYSKKVLTKKFGYFMSRIV